MSRVIKAVFDSEVAGATVLRLLQKADINPSAISVIADINDFRIVSTELAGKMDRLVLICATVFGIAGGVLGYVLALKLEYHGEYAMLVPLMSALCGAVVGTYIGLVAGTVVHFDQPRFIMPVRQGNLSQGKVMVSVDVGSTEEREKVEAIMEQQNALEITSNAAGSNIKQHAA